MDISDQFSVNSRYCNVKYVVEKFNPKNPQGFSVPYV